MLIFEKSRSGRRAFQLPKSDVPIHQLGKTRPTPPALAEVSEIDVIRHYTRLTKDIYSVDYGFYPLGSCTMKYNPKINEDVAALAGFQQIHPLQPAATVPGALALLEEADQVFSEITGMDAFTFQPAAGAQGELTALLIIKAYHASRQDAARTEVIVPDSAHGTNPASANMAGFDVVEVKSNVQGLVDVEALRGLVSEKTAALMLTNPNTLGLFEKDILEIRDIVHDAGGLLYYDGANLNAVMGQIRPGDMGFDAVHLNLHKTFSTPHGGGGPGSGAVGVKGFLKEFLPAPVHAANAFVKPAQSIGRVKQFYGNFLVVVRALTYVKSLGHEGIRQTSEQAVLNANYLKALLEDIFICKDGFCMHEFTVSCQKIKDETGVTALDISKAMIDYGVHPATMYFPLVIKEALMFEPTETESIDTLNATSEILHEIVRLAYEDPQRLKDAPVKQKIKRVDEVEAARKPVLRYVAPEPQAKLD